MVRISYDEKSGSLYLEFSRNPVARTVELKEDMVFLDLDADDKAVGLEVLDMEAITSDMGQLFGEFQIDKAAIREELSRVRSIEPVFA